jgi:hypothetical protein
MANRPAPLPFDAILALFVSESFVALFVPIISLNQSENLYVLTNSTRPVIAGLDQGYYRPGLMNP